MPPWVLLFGLNAKLNSSSMFTKDDTFLISLSAEPYGDNKGYGLILNSLSILNHFYYCVKFCWERKGGERSGKGGEEREKEDQRGEGDRRDKTGSNEIRDRRERDIREECQ